METVKTNRQYKNSVFTALFGEKENLLELYNAIENTNYGKDTDIMITTLENTLFMEQQNDNKGHNKELADRSVLLKDYEIFIYLVREYAKTMDRSTAIIKAIDDCISQNVLKDFLKTNSSEVRNMLFAKWDWDVAKEVWQEEAREDGIVIGEVRGETRVLDLVKKGYNYEQIEKILKNKKSQ